jgi:hypothetical protein
MARFSVKATLVTSWAPCRSEATASRTLIGVSNFNSSLFASAVFEMESMQQAMNDRRNQNPGHTDDREAPKDVLAKNGYGPR